MNDRALLNVWGVAASTLVIAATPAWIWGPRAVIGVLVGGVWNLASLWCLVHLLTAWLGPHPSKRRAIGWPHHLSLAAEGRPSPSPASELPNVENVEKETGLSGRRQVVGWLLLKVALLALLVFGMLRRPGLSIAGFCVGLSVVLVVVVGHFALHPALLRKGGVHAQRMVPPPVFPPQAELGPLGRETGGGMVVGRSHGR